MKKNLLVILASIFFLMQSCIATKDYYKIPAQVSENTFNAVVEIPAGTNKKFEYNKTEKTFKIDLENNVERIIDFLPYPANYGFIPSTLSKKDMGGDGDPLDVLILTESLPTGTVINVIPVAILKLIDNGEADYKIISVPSAKSARIINATTYLELTKDYSKLIEIIELWFLNYNSNDTSSIEAWANEKEACKEIIRHFKN